MNTYEEIEVEIIEFQEEDIISTSVNDHEAGGSTDINPNGYTSDDMSLKG